LAAVESGDAKELAELMRQDPGFDVNMVQDRSGYTLLHLACGGDLRFPVIPLLLAHPDVDINAKDDRGSTPFYWACLYGNTSCVRELLKDSRVEVNEPNNDGNTPLWWSAYYGHIDTIRWWIASGREMDFGEPGDVDKTDAIGVAKKVQSWHKVAQKEKKTKVAALLGRFQSDASMTKHQVRVELGWYGPAAAEILALVVFVSDGLLKTKATGAKAGAKRTRFFSIAAQLPLELQMVLCFRQVESAGEIIQGKESEAAFKELARRL